MRFRKRQDPPTGPDAAARSDDARKPDVADEPGAAPPSIVLATLLNATGFGAAYVYLRRFVRWGFYLLGLFALLTTAYLLEDETVSALWGGAVAWVALSVWDVFRLTRRGTSPIGASRLRRAAVIAASLLILTEIVTFGVFRSAGERALASGWERIDRAIVAPRSIATAG
jgi:hypothetical protein